MSTAVPPGNCPTHGWHDRIACPQCSTSALPPAPLAPSGMVAANEPKVSRHRVARDLYERLSANPPHGCEDISEPDSLATLGLDFGSMGYLLVRVEDVKMAGRQP